MIIETTRVLHIHTEDDLNSVVYLTQADMIGYIFIYSPLTIEVFQKSQIYPSLMEIFLKGGQVIQL